MSFLRCIWRQRLLQNIGSRVTSSVTMTLTMGASSVPSHSRDGRRCTWTSLQNYTTRLCWRWMWRKKQTKRSKLQRFCALKMHQISSAGFLFLAKIITQPQQVLHLWWENIPINALSSNDILFPTVIVDFMVHMKSNRYWSECLTSHPSAESNSDHFSQLALVNMSKKE